MKKSSKNKTTDDLYIAIDLANQRRNELCEFAKLHGAKVFPAMKYSRIISLIVEQGVEVPSNFNSAEYFYAGVSLCIEKPFNSKTNEVCVKYYAPGVDMQLFCDVNNLNHQAVAYLRGA